MKNDIVIFDMPFVFYEKETSRKHEICYGISVQERKRWRGVTQAKVLCSFQGKVKSRWINVSDLKPASFSQIFLQYHGLENACVNDPEIAWMLPSISNVLFIALDKYVPLEAIRHVSQSVKTRYSTPQREWHNEKHIGEVLLFLLHHFGSIQTETCPSWLLLDAIFHDSIYIPGYSGNEQDSVEFMKDNILFLHEERRANARRIGLLRLPGDGSAFMYWPERDYARGILATKNHKDDSPLIRTLLDADMEVLSGGRNRYRRYARAIRKEFRQYNDTEYTKGRIKFLQTLLNSPSPIFSSKFSTKTMEDRARQNILWEIDMLQNEQII